MPNYLFSVIVYNLLPGDYEKERVEQIESDIVGIIREVDKGSYRYASEKNTALSFPLDPSVKSPEVPVMVSVRFHNGIRDGAVIEAREMIKGNLRLTAFKGRGDVIVDIHSLIN